MKTSSAVIRLFLFLFLAFNLVGCGNAKNKKERVSVDRAKVKTTAPNTKASPDSNKDTKDEPLSNKLLANAQTNEHDTQSLIKEAQTIGQKSSLSEVEVGKYQLKQIYVEVEQKGENYQAILKHNLTTAGHLKLTANLLDEANDHIDFRYNQAAPYVISSGLIIAKSLEINEEHQVSSTDEAFYSLEINEKEGAPFFSDSQIDVSKLVELVNNPDKTFDAVVVKTSPLTLVVTITNEAANITSTFTLSYEQSPQKKTDQEKTESANTEIQEALAI